MSCWWCDVYNLQLDVGACLPISAEFPFISYYVINTTQTDPSNFYTGIRGASLSKFEPRNLRYTAAHTLDLYSEVASICRPPIVVNLAETGSVKKSQTPSTGYIISVYKVSISNF